MRAIWLGGFIIAAAVVLGAPAWAGGTAAQQKALSDCLDDMTMTPDPHACDRIINDKRQPASIRAEALTNRADLWQDVNPQQAMTDYTLAAKLDPTNSGPVVGIGDLYHKAGDDQRALAQYDAAVASFPNNVDALTSRANFYSQTGDFDDALTDIDSAIDSVPDGSPNLADLYNQRGAINLAAEKYPNAIADYGKAADLDTDSAAYVNRLGIAYALSGDFTNAAAAFTKAVGRRGDVDIDDDDEKALSQKYLGAVAMDKGDFATAISDFGAYNKAAFEVDGDGFRSLAMAQLYGGDAADAIGTFGKAAEEDGYDDDAVANTDLDFVWTDIARQRAGQPSTLAKDASGFDGSKWAGPIVQLFLGKSSPDDVQSAAAGDRQQCQANFFVGEWLLRQKQPGDAIPLLQAAAAKCDFDTAERHAAIVELAAMPPAPAATTAAAQSGSGQSASAPSLDDCSNGNSDACTAIINDGSASASDRSQAFSERGFAREKDGAYDDAIDDETQALALDPTNTFGYFFRSLAEQNANKLDAALADAEKFAGAQPDNYVAWQRRGIVEALQHNLTDAQADYAKALALKPDASIYISRASMWLAAGKFDEGLADLNSAVAADDQNPFRYYQRGVGYLIVGDFARATADFQKAGTMSDSLLSPIWASVAMERAGQPIALDAAVAKADMSQWPAPIANFLLGKMDADSMLAAAAKTEICEDAVVAGEHALARNDLAGANKLLTTASENCLAISEEHVLAVVELARLAPASPASPAPSAASPPPAATVATPPAADSTPPAATADATPPAPATAAATASSPAATADQSVEITFWNSIAQSKNPADYQAYLTQFPAGAFVALAKNRLAELASPPSASAASAAQPAAPAYSGPMRIAVRGHNGGAKVTGAFTRNDDGTWEETNDDNADWTYQLVDQSSSAIDLADPTRNVTIRLDLKQRLVDYKGPNDTKWFPLYTITSVN